MASGHSLIQAEELLDNIDSKSSMSLNDLFEIYNIYLHFKNGIYLSKWSNDQKNKYVKITEKYFTNLKAEILRINDDNIEELLNQLEFDYKVNFWQLLEQLNSFKNLTNVKFKILLQDNENQLNYILQQKKIVVKFGQEIREYLLGNDESAEILLSTFEEKESLRRKAKYYFPKCLAMLDKEKIINTYLDKDNPNLNYVRLVEQSKDSDYLKLTDRTRLKAKRKSEKLNNEILESNNSWRVGVEVLLSEDQAEIVKFENNSGILKASYSQKFLDQCKNDFELFQIFKFPFQYTDETSLISLVSKENELDTMETIFMMSKNEYNIGQTFFKKKALAFSQLRIFEHYLNKRKNAIANLINNFIKSLNARLKTDKITFITIDSNKLYIEKIRTLLPEIDFLLKQYNSLAEDGNIDIELLQISSKPIGFGQIKSQVKLKYIYSEHESILKLKNQFFSNQSHLFYTDKFKSKHKNLYELITKEEVVINDFSDYQIEIIQKLIDDGYLKIGSEDHLKIDNLNLIHIVRNLFTNEVINYWHQPEFIRKEIDLLLIKKIVYSQNTLFSQSEKNYLNYHFNKKEFTNGNDLRNKYLHGTNTHSSNQHETDYYLILQILILILLKIENDIILSKVETITND